LEHKDIPFFLDTDVRYLLFDSVFLLLVVFDYFRTEYLL